MMKEQIRTIGILGTGEFARALAKRLYLSGYDVIIGSRRPEEAHISATDECLYNLRLMTAEECIESVSIIFLAVHAEHFKDLLGDHADKLNGKIVVDVSNRDRPSKSNSNAEYLQTLLPQASVVKAFNVISAYALENDYNMSSRQVFIASNNDLARTKVSNIAHAMNFTPIDLGNLVAARRIEKHPLLLFPDWGKPCGFTIVLFIIWLLYLICIYYVEQTTYAWGQIFVKVLNKAICMTGITVLSVTYLPSSFAAIFQVYYGTKHIRFAGWLDKWLKTRKQLGLISFTLITIHILMSTLIMSPTYYRWWYHSTKITIPYNMSRAYEIENINWMTWKGEAACMTGIFSFTTLCLVCVSSLPSVANSLNWREWRFVQSKLGHVALFLAVVHVLVMGIPGWLNNPRRIYKSITFLSSILPWLTLLLKLFFTIPYVDGYVTKIRKGWERKERRCQAKCVRQKKEDLGVMNAKDAANPESGLFPESTIQMVSFDGNE